MWSVLTPSACYIHLHNCVIPLLYTFQMGIGHKNVFKGCRQRCWRCSCGWPVANQLNEHWRAVGDCGTGRGVGGGLPQQSTNWQQPRPGLMYFLQRRRLLDWQPSQTYYPPPTTGPAQRRAKARACAATLDSCVKMFYLAYTKCNSNISFL